MSRLAALILAVLATACGLDADLDPGLASTAPELPALEARPVEPTVVQKSAANEAVRLQRAQSDTVRPVSAARAMVVQPPASAGVGVDVELELRWNAVGLTGLVAVPSCGWWPIASATAVGHSGAATFTFVPREELDFTQFSDGQLFFFVDHDADGACDESKGDEVLTAPLGALSGATSFQVGLGQLLPSPYSCSLFSYLP